MYIASSKQGGLYMKTGAQMAGFMLRAQSREETAAFYRKLGLSAD
jgi:hypothetical protein